MIEANAFLIGLFGALIGLAGVIIGIFLREAVSHASNKRKIAAILTTYLGSLYGSIMLTGKGIEFLHYATIWDKEIDAYLERRSVESIQDMQRRRSEIEAIVEKGFKEKKDYLIQIKNSVEQFDKSERSIMLKNIDDAIESIVDHKLFPSDQDISVMPAFYLQKFIQFRMSLVAFLQELAAVIRYYDSAGQLDDDKLATMSAKCAISLFEMSRHFDVLLSYGRKVQNRSLLRLVLSRR